MLSRALKSHILELKLPSEELLKPSLWSLTFTVSVAENTAELPLLIWIYADLVWCDYKTVISSGSDCWWTCRAHEPQFNQYFKLVPCVWKQKQKKCAKEQKWIMNSAVLKLSMSDHREQICVCSCTLTTTPTLSVITHFKCCVADCTACTVICIYGHFFRRCKH